MVPHIIRRLAAFLLFSTLLAAGLPPAQPLAAAMPASTAPAVPPTDLAQIGSVAPKATGTAITLSTTLPQVSGGGGHTCVINSAGKLTCWGDNASGQATVPSDLGAVTQVSAGGDHTCAVTSANALRCWGANADLAGNTTGQATVPSNLGAVTQVSAGWYYTCVVTSANALRCWGLNASGQATVPSDIGAVSQVSVGMYHTCAVTSANALRCWGSNSFSQATVPSDLGPVSQVSVRGNYTCAVTHANALRCWGDNTYGQATVPSDLGAVSQVSAGGNHTCAVTSANALRCWGNNTDGQVTVPSDLGTVSRVSAGSFHTCAVTSANALRCWGGNAYGQAIVPNDLGAVTQVNAGGYHTCAVTSTNTIRCWGDNTFGQTMVPSNLGAVSQVSVNGYHTCTVTSANALRCWGRNTTGQATVPSDLGAVSQGDVGAFYTCAVTSTNALRCWGSNTSGQTTVPSDLGAVSQISLGDFHTCALTSANALRCWGRNDYGEATVPSNPLGTSTTYAISGRVSTSTDTGVAGVAIATGTGLSAVSAADGSFTLAGVAPGTYTLTPTKSGYTFTPATRSVTVSNGDLGGQDFVGTLVPATTYTIIGRVATASSVAVAGVTVSTGTGLSAVSAADGSFTLAGVAPGTYTLTPTKSGYTFTPATRSVTVASGDLSGQDFSATGSVPGNDDQPVLGRPAQSRVVGGVTIYAADFSGGATNWTASGTVWIGAYTIVDSANLSYNGSTLSGSGLVSMITAADGHQRTTLFQDNFDVSAAGTLTPRAVNGGWRMNNLVGFQIEHPPTTVSLDTVGGQLAATLDMKVVIPNNQLVKSIGVTLNHNGAASGVLSDATFSLGSVGLHVARASLSAAGFQIEEAELTLPATLGGTRSALTVSASIKPDGTFSLAGGAISLNFPNIKVGGTNGFAIEGAKATLRYASGTYEFHGEGAFLLPGVGPSEGGCRVGTNFTLASTPPPLRNAALTIAGCFKIPIGSTGFFLTSVSGSVSLDANNVAVDIGVGIEGGPEIPGLGAALSGEPAAHWDTSWKVGLSGTLKVFKFDVAQAALSLSRARGLEGTIHLSLSGGLIDGTGSLHIWNDGSSFHMTGSEQVAVRVERGGIYNQCSFGICLLIPPDSITGPTAGADFGEFRVGNTTTYGIKGYVSVLGYAAAYFADAGGNLRFGTLEEYQLVGAAGVGLQANSDIRAFTVAPNTPALIIGLSVSSGTPTLSLTTPDGQSLTSSSPGVVATVGLTQTLLTVNHPLSGRWQAQADALTGAAHILTVLGVRPTSTVRTPTVTDNGDGSYTIGVMGSSSTPTSTLSLFYDVSPSDHTGMPIVQDLPITTTSYLWRPSAVVTGTYHLYAMVDDPLDAPAYAYSATTIQISDRTPPDAPTGLRARDTGGSALINWTPSLAPDVAGYRIAYREPASGTTFISDVPDGQRTSYTQQGLYLNGAWQIAISAYDINGNESSRSPTVDVAVSLYRVFLPAIRR